MKRFFSFVLLLSVLVTAGLGCKGPDQEVAIQQLQVKLDYWTVFNDVAQLKKMADEYKRIRPYVTVNIRQVRYEEFDQLFTNALADDAAPDMISIFARSVGKYQNRLAPMPSSVKVTNIAVKGQYVQETVVTQQNLAMPSANDVRKNYVTTVGEDVIIGNQVYGLPLALDTLALYYNKDLLDQAGVPLPPKTWEEFTDAVKKGTKFDRTGKIIQSGVALGTPDNIDNAPDIFALLLMQNGIELTKGRDVTFENGVERGDIQQHPTVNALRFYTDFARVTKDVYTWNEEMGNALEQFTRGKSVFYFGFAYDAPRIRARAPQMNVEVTTIPQHTPEANKNVANYWVESVVKKSNNQNEAWDFIRFLSAPENIKKYTDVTRQPTPLRSQINDQLKNETLAPFASQALAAKNWYRGRDVDTATRAIRTLIREYRKPYGDNQNPNKRDADLISNTARVIQQTM